jgi:glycosyltransferase involved in cell wall biosynthesis
MILFGEGSLRSAILTRKRLRGKRVLMLLENLTYPQDPRVRKEARALADAGYQVSVICPAGPGQPWREMLDGVLIYRYPAPPVLNGALGYLWEYGYAMVATCFFSLFVLIREGFDVVHAHNPPDTFVFIAAFYKLFGKCFVFDHHDIAPELYCARFGSGNRLVYKVLVWLETLSCRLANHVIATNHSYKTVEMQRGHVPEERITIVRNGPNRSRRLSVNPDPSLRPPGKIVIGYVGVMGSQDGVDYLLRALRHLACDFDRTDFFCLLVGAGSAVPDLKTLAKQLDLTHCVWFTGWVEPTEVDRYINAMDICVAPEPSNIYNDRSTMIKVMEYMAMEKPVVAFDLPENRYTAQTAALYARPNDELEFARALTQLMDDPVRRQTMGAFGGRRVQNELAWSYSVPHLLTVYRTVLTERYGQEPNLQNNNRAGCAGDNGDISRSYGD